MSLRSKFNRTSLIGAHCHRGVREPLKLRESRRAVSSYYQIQTEYGRARLPVLNASSHFGHYTSRVNRPYNEDRYYGGVLTLPVGSSLTSKSMRKLLGKKDRQVFNFAVFDGHGGSECSQFLKDELATYVETCDLGSGWELRDQYRKNVGGYWRAWGPELERYVSSLTHMDDLQLRVPLAFLKADYDFINGIDKAGSTCTSVYLYSLDDGKMFWEPDQVTNLVVAHVGDTRCIIADSNGHVNPLTSNHHPSSPIENTRLRRYVSSFFTDSFGEERYGAFANTRAFGDSSFKSMGITAEPEIAECRLGDTALLAKLKDDSKNIQTFSGSEAFLVLMSDGVTGLMTDQEVADIVINTANKAGSGRGTPQDAAKEVVHFCEAVGGDDNATCLVVRLPGWGKWDRWTDRTGSTRENRLRSGFDRVSHQR